MSRSLEFCADVWWLVHKDLVREYRARMVWPAMLLMGFVIALVFELQMDLPAVLKLRVGGGMLWLAVFFAGTLALERCFTGERDESCWDALRLYPVAPAAVFLAKLLFCFAALAGVECVLVPAFALLSDMPLLTRPAALVLVAALANLGFAAAGTLISALANGLHRRGNVLVLLLLPAVLPVVLGAADATRLLAAGDLGPQFWRWVQLLTCFAVTYVTVGVLLFEFVMED